MLKMVERQRIIHYYRRDGMSKRQIALRMGISRHTVDRVLAEYEASVDSDNSEALENLLTMQPVYNSRGRKPRKLSQAIAGQIDELVEINRRTSSSPDNSTPSNSRP